ncbi:MAG TPA: PEP-CTERM sorting domain-containing protein [Tepidisphaeraceae bacterium]|nr:PEP-CTERM sorting domain-containing protein [Tepidisphaeraceae bacterium]
MLQLRRVSTLTAAVAGLAFTSALHAAVIASDSASNSPYTSGSGDTATSEFNGLNGGAGFGAWVVTDTENPPATGATTSSPTGNGGAFITTSVGSETDGRNPAPTFDVYDNGNASSSSATGAALGSSIETATRPFNTAMTTGGTFSFVESLASLRGENAGVPTSQLGFELLDSSGNVLLNMYCYGGGPGFYLTDAVNTGLLTFSTDSAHSGSSSRAWTINSSSGDTVAIALTGPDATNPSNDDYVITTGGHEGSTFADGGEINMSTGGPAAFVIYDDNGGTGSDIRVNNLSESAVPEPASIALAGVGLSALLRRRRR